MTTPALTSPPTPLLKERGVEMGMFEAAYVDLLVAIADWLEVRDADVVDHSDSVGADLVVSGSVVMT